jgi:hypothetical protein
MITVGITMVDFAPKATFHHKLVLVDSLVDLSLRVIAIETVLLKLASFF